MCELCKGIGGQPLTSEQRKKIHCDPNFKYIVAIGGPTNDDKLLATMNKCVMFLKEFGHVKWCKEIELVLKMYEELARICYRKILR